MPSMTFAKIEPTIYFTGPDDALRQLVTLTLTSDTATEAAIVFKAGQIAERFDIGSVPAGESKHDITIPDIREPMDVAYELEVAGDIAAKQVLAHQPQRHWDIHFQHFSHHDLGYTDLPSRILADHDTFFDEILEFCEQTKDFPHLQKFRYQVEEAWSVCHWIDNRPKEIVDRFMQFVHAGQIDIPALFGNQTSELCGHEEQHRLLYPARRLKREYGIELTSAMHNDVPGFSWGLAGALAMAGVKYLCLGVPAWYCEAVPAHPCWDEEGVVTFEVPAGFWWEVPNGQKLFTWSNLHGGELNPLGYHDCFEKLPDMIEKLERNNYAWDSVCYTVGSGHRDNSPPSYRFVELAQQWADKWSYPRVINSTNEMFLSEVSQNTSSFKTLRGEFPNTDYTVCATSTPQELGINRNAHQALRRAETLATITKQLCTYEYPADQLDEAYINTFYYDLHCWGMAHPGGPGMDACLAEKTTFAFRTAALAQDAEMKAANRIADNIAYDDGAHLTIFNPQAHERGGVVIAPFNDWAPIGLPMMYRTPPNEHGEKWLSSGWCIDRQVQYPPEWLMAKPFKLIDTVTGETIPHQVRVTTDPQAATAHAAERVAMRDPMMRHDLVFAPTGVPSVGHKTYTVIELETHQPVKTHAIGLTVDNDFLTLRVDEATGDIASYFDKALGHELVDVDAPHRMTQLFVRSAKTSQDMPGGRIDSVTVVDDGPVFTTIRVRGGMVGVPMWTKEITVYHTFNRVDVAVRLLKDSTPIIEGFMAFPFAVEAPQFRFEGGGSVVEPTVDQLAGTSTDSYAIQHWANVYNEDGGVMLTPLDAPMMEFGGIYAGYVSGAHHGETWPEYGHEFLAPGSLTTSHMYSMLFYNNYYTNFVNVRAGEVLLRYSLTSGAGDWQADAMRQFGWDVANPCWPAWMNGKQDGEIASTDSFVSLDAANVELSTIKPAEDGRGVIVRLMETVGRAGDVTATFPHWTIGEATLTNNVEEGADPLLHTDTSVTVPMVAFDTATIRLILN
jgi:hypothetical protein